MVLSPRGVAGTGALRSPCHGDEEDRLGRVFTFLLKVRRKKYEDLFVILCYSSSVALLEGIRSIKAHNTTCKISLARE